MDDEFQPRIAPDFSQPFPDVYKSEPVESGWYDWWKQKGYFQARPSAQDQTVSMILPPPNVTGTLHLGHALTVAIEDTICRWHRMKGQRVVWIPGYDHAGIATQTVVEKILAKQGKTREDLGRDTFCQEVFKWKDEKQETISKQLEGLGASLDWSRECFTMSSTHTRAVETAFKTFYDKGLIYRDKRLVNWSCALKSSISDIEVDHLDIDKPTKIKVPGYAKPISFGSIFDVAYQVAESRERLVVSTTRPETLLGDVAVAVHPDDARYQHLIGRTLLHPLGELSQIPVVADESVDKTFGTGAVKVTPAHDFNDFERGLRHKLPVITVFNKHGRVVSKHPEFNNLPRFEARWKVIGRLKELDLFEGSKPHTMSVPICSRSGDVVEPLIQPQWFLKCSDMTQKALNSNIQLNPDLHHKVWRHWLSDARDWCISRQLWWGHQIPMYHCSSDEAGQGFWICSLSEHEARTEAVKKMESNPSDLVVQRDTDVLDTWFSSALLPFANFGWPDKANDLTDGYPLTLMETGHDILFFWVARMVMMGLELTGQLPFQNVLLHGIICDGHGRKMSKSLGNVIDPGFITKGITVEEMQRIVLESNRIGQISEEETKKALDGIQKDFPSGIPECGADALRFGLLSYDVKGLVMNLDIRWMTKAAAFCNKIWQASRFFVQAHQRLQESGRLDDLKPCLQPTRPENRWIMSRCAVTVAECNDSLDKADFHVLTRALREFMYTNLCDVYLESIKPIVFDPTHPDFEETLSTLSHALMTGLKLLHPVMPFVTEELYHRLPLLPSEVRQESIMIDEYPGSNQWSRYENQDLMKAVDLLGEIVSAVRHLKKSLNVPRSAKPDVLVITPDPTQLDALVSMASVLAPCGDINLVKDEGDPKSEAVSSFHVMAPLEGSNTTVFVDLRGHVNVKVEVRRLRDEVEKLETKLAKLSSGKKAGSKSIQGKVQDLNHKKTELLNQLEFLEKYEQL